MTNSIKLTITYEGATNSHEVNGLALTETIGDVQETIRDLLELPQSQNKIAFEAGLKSPESGRYFMFHRIFFAESNYCWIEYLFFYS